MAKLKSLSVQPEMRTAQAQPGLHGGLNSRSWGLACQSVVGIDVVTADGTLVHTSAKEHEDLYWAARGSGTGFFGIVTKFYLKLHPIPRGMMVSQYVVPIQYVGDLLNSLDEVQNTLPRCLDSSVFIGRDQGGLPGFSILVIAASLAATTAEARESLAIIDDIPAIGKADVKNAFHECDIEFLLNSAAQFTQANGLRFHADDMWTDSPTSDLLDGIHHMIEDLPPSPSHLYINYWRPVQPIPDMAFSMQARSYAIHTDPELDGFASDLVVKHMRALSTESKGIQLSDENLVARPARFMNEDNFRRLEAIRRVYDPSARFHFYFDLPEEFKRITRS